jgi:hypothetical protein
MTPIVKAQDIVFKIYLLVKSPAILTKGKEFRYTNNKIVGADGTGKKQYGLILAVEVMIFC